LTPEFTEARMGPENLIVVLVLGLGLLAPGETPAVLDGGLREGTTSHTRCGEAVVFGLAGRERAFC
jgi:hypothetical protein